MQVPIFTSSVRVGWILVDDEDYPQVVDRLWRLATGYAAHKSNGEQVYLHRWLLGMTPGDGLEVDHINGEKLDNRRANLRRCSHAENSQNQPARAMSTSPYRGVSWHSASKKWRAQGQVNGENVSIGYFTSELEAAAAAATWRRLNLPFASAHHDAPLAPSVMSEERTAA